MPVLIEGAPASLEVEGIPEQPDEAERLGEVQFMITSPGRPNLATLLAKMPRLKVVQTVSAGVDVIVPMLPEGVTLCSARGAYSIVAEWVVGAILAAFKSFPIYRDRQRDGRWSLDSDSVRRLTGSTVLIVGYGGIAQAVEERLVPFGVEMLRVARRERSGVATLAELPALLPRADAVVLLVPLTAETDGLVDAGFLAAMRADAVLVNAARGRVVQTDALVAALRTGRISAVLDVTDPEPLPEHHELFGIPNVFITPHIAGGRIARTEVFEFLAGQLRRFALGEPLANVVSDGY